MSQETDAAHTENGRDWQRITVAFLAGLIVFSFMAAHVVLHQPAIGATINALPLFVVTFAIGVIAFPLVYWETSSGYWLTVLAAVVGLVSLGLVGSGTVGSMKAGTPPIAPPVFALIAVILIISTFLARST